MEDDDADKKSNEFRAFSISIEKLLIKNLLNYAKEATYEKMQFEEAVTDCLHINLDGPTIDELTDREICDIVLLPEMTESEDDDDCDNDDGNIDDIPIDECIYLTRELIRSLETKFHY